MRHSVCLHGSNMACPKANLRRAGECESTRILNKPPRGPPMRRLAIILVVLCPMQCLAQNASDTSTAAQQQHAQEQESHSADYTARHSTSDDNDNN